MDAVGEFLKACEHANAQQVQQMLSLWDTDPDFNIVCTQGAVMAAARKRWDTVLVLSPHVDVSVADFILVRTTCAHQQWNCMKELTKNLGPSNARLILEHVSSSLFASDASDIFMGVFNQAYTPPHIPSLFTLANNAVKVGAFSCLDAIINTVGMPKNLLADLVDYANMVNFRQKEFGAVLIENLQNFEGWKQKKRLEQALGELPPTLRSRKL